MVETGLANAIVTGVVTGSIVALGAIGLALVYSIAEVPNFAHGELLTIGAYLALVVNHPNTVPLFSELTPAAQRLGPVGYAVLFVLAAGAVLGIVYLLGGRRTLTGESWPVDVPAPAAAGVNVAVAALLGAAVAVGFPSIWAAVLLSGLLLSAAAPLQETFVFRQFREKGASLATMLIAALGLSFVLRFGTQAFYGGQPRFYRIPDVGTVFGREVSLSAARWFDLYLTGDGFVLEVIATEVLNAPGDVDPTMAVVGWGWPAVVAVVAGTAVAAGAAYRFRDRPEYAGATVGPRLSAAIAGALAFGALALGLAGGATVPETSVAATRMSLSVVRAGVVVIAVVMMASLHLLLKETRLGTAMRAASDNKDLAKVTGVNTDRVMTSTWVIAGAFAAVGGVMLGILFDSVRITMGFNLLLPMFAGVILGGIGSVYGAILGSFLVGLTMDVGIYLLDINAVYRVPIAFVALFVVLLVRPEGIVGGG